MFTYYASTSGAELLRLSADAVSDCSHPGPCDDDVAAWVNDVEWLADDATLRDHLAEYGAWDDLGTADQTTLRQRTLWIAACDINEDPAPYAEED